MKTALLAAVAALPLATAPAFAGEGNGEPFPYTGSAALVANVPTHDTGSERGPNLGSAFPPVAVVEGSVLPSNGSEAALETANSLPRGFADGTVAYVQAQSGQRAVLAGQARPGAMRVAAPVRAIAPRG